jgi:phosphoglycolate phosphatase
MGRKIINVIMDVDGTLLDSKRDIAAAQHWVLTQLGVHQYRPEQLYRTIGKKLEDTFRQLLPPEFHHRIPEATAMYRNYYRPRALETTKLFPGVPETLEELRTRGKKLAVATTKSTATTHRILAHFKIDHHFAQLQGTDGVPYKPNPYILTKIIEDQRWVAAETLMVGDAREDIKAGQAAGVRTCGVTYGALSRTDLEKVSNNYLIDRFPELLEIVL